VRAVGNVTRPGEHHVLEEVRETGPARHLVLGTNVIPYVDRDSRNGVVYGKNDRETVLEVCKSQRDTDRIR
jgi:hypothetical protein